MLPQEIGDAAQNGDRDRVMAWLNAGGSIDDVDEDGYTLVNCCVCGDRDSKIVNDRHVALARHLIALGADVNIASRAAPMHQIVQRTWGRQAILEMLSLLLGAGANVNARDGYGHTPLWYAIRHDPEHSLTLITKLLRAGALLDACNGRESAEDILQRRESQWAPLAGHEHWKRLRALVAGVRKYGTYKKYMRAPHRDVLAVRGLAQRGKLSTNDPVLHFLARLGDNGVCWHILSFWRAAN